MTLLECYERTGSDYQDVMKRLGNEALIRRIAAKFPKDTSFQKLQEGFLKEDGELAFQGAHALKGICLNLGFTRLGKISSELTESLREKKEMEECRELFETAEIEYKNLTAVLEQL